MRKTPVGGRQKTCDMAGPRHFSNATSMMRDEVVPDVGEPWGLSVVLWKERADVLARKGIHVGEKELAIFYGKT